MIFIINFKIKNKNTKFPYFFKQWRLTIKILKNSFFKTNNYQITSTLVTTHCICNISTSYNTFLALPQPHEIKIQVKSSSIIYKYKARVHIQI